MVQHRIHLIATPRNISTALMYSFAQRPDTVVFDEPLYAHYLIKSGALHPGREEIIRSMEGDAGKIIEKTFLGPHEKAILFIKNMSHHLYDLRLDFLPQLKTLMLIRDPYEMLTSYAKVNPHPTMLDIGLQMQYRLHQALDSSAHPPVLVDAMNILKDPAQMLESICSKMDISFDPAMLNWDPGARKEDGVWAKYWYSSVHKSTGFQPYQRKTEELPNYLRPLYEEVKPYYDALYERSLQLEN